jgi:hypothetical protein
MRTYVDESMCFNVEESAYVFGAAILDDEHVNDVREKVKELKVSGLRFHWRREAATSQDAAVATLIGLPAIHLVVVGTPLDLRRQERGRRKCLERLLYELAHVGVSQVWLESRNKLLDERDIKIVDVMRVRGGLGSQIRVSHGKPLGEPLLWLGDLIAGAYAAQDPRHREMLADALVCETCRVDLS